MIIFVSLFNLQIYSLMKKLLLLICTIMFTNLSSQHVIELRNNTPETIDVTLFAVLDVCGGSFTITSITVPAFTTTTTSTAATPPTLDEVLLHVGVTNSGGLPVTASVPHFTPGLVYNISTASPPCILPLTGSYTSAAPPFTSYSISWTSGPATPPATTTNGNAMQHDVITFF